VCLKNFSFEKEIFFLAKILLLLVAFQIVDACCVILSFLLLLLLFLSWGCRGMNFLERFFRKQFFLFCFDLKIIKILNFFLNFLSQKLINSEIMFLKFWIIFAKKFSFVNDVVISHSRNLFAVCVWTKNFSFLSKKNFFFEIYFGQKFILLAKNFFHKMHNPKRCVWVEISRKYHLIFTSNCLCSFFPSVFIVLCTFLSSSRDAQIFIIFFMYKIHTALKRITKVTKQKIIFRVLFTRGEKSGRKCCKSFTFVARIFFLFSSFSRNPFCRLQNTQNKITKKYIFDAIFFPHRPYRKNYYFFVYNLQKIFFKKCNALFYLFIYFSHQLYFLNFIFFLFFQCI